VGAPSEHLVDREAAGAAPEQEDHADEKDRRVDEVERAALDPTRGCERADHVGCEHEGCGPSEEPDDEEQTADELDDTDDRDGDLGPGHFVLPKVRNFLGAIEELSD
jgi:hypothetical protein